MTRGKEDTRVETQESVLAITQEAAMAITQEELDELLTEVIHQARSLEIPLSLNINENVVVNQRAKSRFGCCRKIQAPTLKNRDIIKKGAKDRETVSSKEAGNYKVGPIYVIEISKALSEAPSESIKEVLAHEILHTTPGGDRHTGNWKKYANLMNKTYGYHIQRTNSPESLCVNLAREKTPARYLIICQSCGTTIERSRKSKVIKQPSLYRCKCGGALKVRLVR